MMGGNMEKEFSAIDAIYLILDKINNLEKKMQVIDDNIKILNNKVTKLNKNVSQDTTRVMPTASTTNQPSLADQEYRGQTEVREPEKLLLGPVKIYGYIVNRSRHPVENVVVNLFDSSNKLVKTNKTNQDGYWESRISSGKYNVEYIHNKFKPVSKEIDIPKTAKEYEVK
jgi:hypothetical protein